MRGSLYEEQRFSQEYFAGSDITFRFGDQKIEEIVNLEYSIMERVQPVYSYAHFAPVKFARGSRMIQGSFTINFTSPDYLHSVIREIQAKHNAVFEQSPAWDVDAIVRTAQSKGIDIGMSLEEIKDQINSPEDAEAMAKKLGGIYWREKRTRDLVEGNTTYFYRQSDFDLLDKGFNIQILYGNSNKEGSRAKVSNSIIGVQLLGMSKSISGRDGAPVQEMYQFMAKDII